MLLTGTGKVHSGTMIMCCANQLDCDACLENHKPERKPTQFASAFARGERQDVRFYQIAYIEIPISNELVYGIGHEVTR